MKNPELVKAALNAIFPAEKELPVKQNNQRGKRMSEWLRCDFCGQYWTDMHQVEGKVFCPDCLNAYQDQKESHPFVTYCQENKIVLYGQINNGLAVNEFR